MSEVLDLDALVPPSVTIKFGGSEIEVKPPKTGDVLRLGTLGQKLSDASEASAEDVDKLVSMLTEQIGKCIPELAGKEFNTAQLMKLVEIISKMAIPPDVKELEDRGITTDGPKA